MTSFLSRWLVLWLCVLQLAGPAFGGEVRAPGYPRWSPDEEATLRRYARDTWRSFEPMVLATGLPADGLCHSKDGSWKPTGQTSPTDIAAYLWSVYAAEALHLIESEEAHRRFAQTLRALDRLEQAHGFFFNRYNPRTGERRRTDERTGGSIHPFLSTVDNAWLASALVMIGNTHPRLGARAGARLAPMDFSFFYEPFDPDDPKNHPGQLYGGFRTDKKTFTDFYSMLNTEPRIASYLGIARGQVLPEHYFRMRRTLPRAFPQEQVPQGVERAYRDVRVFEGHYTYRGMRIVPSWGGSMFEALMVALLVPEARWAPRSWGTNHSLYVRAQIEHGLEEARYGFWGFSSANKPEGGYRPYGVEALGTDPDGYTSNNDDTRTSPDDQPLAKEFTNGVVTPHASFLALQFAPREALANLRALEAKFSIYGRYGFHDSVNVQTGVVSDCVLALDQGMILAALANALAENALQHAFSDGMIETAIRPLLSEEEFTAGVSDAAETRSNSGDISSH